jgi:hypothetical protein
LLAAHRPTPVPKIVVVPVHQSTFMMNRILPPLQLLNPDHNGRRYRRLPTGNTSEPSNSAKQPRRKSTLLGRTIRRWRTNENSLQNHHENSTALITSIEVLN